MKKFVIILICLVIVGIGAFYGYYFWQTTTGEKDNFSTWKTFVPTSKLFEVSLPNPPQYGKDYIQIPDTNKKRRYDMYASEKIDGTLFLISVITYPTDYEVSTSLDVLQQNIDELMHQKADNHMNNLWQNMFQQHNSLGFSFENKDFRVEGRSIHDGHIVYMLSYITKKENFDENEFNSFINSFKILKPSDEALKKSS